MPRFLKTRLCFPPPPLPHEPYPVCSFFNQCLQLTDLGPLLVPQLVSRHWCARGSHQYPGLQMRLGWGCSRNCSHEWLRLSLDCYLQGWQAGTHTQLPLAEREGRNIWNHPGINHQRWKSERWCKILIRQPFPRALPHVSRAESALRLLHEQLLGYQQQTSKERRQVLVLQKATLMLHLFHFILLRFVFSLQRENKFNRRQMHFMIFNNFVPWFNHSILRTSIKSVFKTNNST